MGSGLGRHPCLSRLSFSIVQALSCKSRGGPFLWSWLSAPWALSPPHLGSTPSQTWTFTTSSAHSVGCSLPSRTSFPDDQPILRGSGPGVTHLLLQPRCRSVENHSWNRSCLPESPCQDADPLALSPLGFLSRQRWQHAGQLTKMWTWFISTCHAHSRSWWLDIAQPAKDTVCP